MNDDDLYYKFGESIITYSFWSKFSRTIYSANTELAIRFSVKFPINFSFIKIKHNNKLHDYSL